MSQRKSAATAAMLFSAVLLSITAVPASATDTDPVGGLLDTATTLLAPVTSPTPVKSSVDAPPPSDDSDLPGNETVDPVAPDHAATKGVETTLGGNAVAGASQDNATINDDDSTTAQSTLLSLGGNQVLGTDQASSTGDNHTEFDPLAPLTTGVCDGTAGGVCLKVLYASSDATDDGTTSHAESKSGVASVCLGGTVTDGSTCDGAVSTGLATSHAQADRNQASGRTTASSQYSTADVCVGGTLGTACQVGADALSSQGQADSGDGSTPSSASRSSNVLGLQFGGQPPSDFTDPTDLSIIQPQCASPSLLCLFLNQGETYLADGIAGHAQDALKLTVLPGTPLEVFTGIGRTETLVHNDGGEIQPPPPDKCKTDCGNDDDDGDGDNGDRDNGVLPDTGGPWSGLLAIGMLGIAAGSFAVAGGRRRTRTIS